MICFRCGEKNPDTYRFCGMCGGPIQAAKPASGSAPAPPAEPPPEPISTPAPESRSENFPFSRAERLAKSAPAERVAPISGPSMLGLNEPSLDSLREKAFSSADETYFEPETRGPAWQRIFMTLVVLGALGGAAWWGYANYAQPGASTPQSSETKPDASAANPPAATVPQKKEAPPPAASTSVPTETSTTAETKKPGEQSQENGSTPSGTSKTDEQASGNDTAAPEQAPSEPLKPVAKPQPETSQPKSQPKNKAPAVKPATSVVARKATPAAEKPVKAPPAVVPAEGDAFFRRGDAYLFGRGVAQSCDEAIKYLKSASDKSNAKARSTFGTMYATGHCVSRDLPTSYRWFALALRVDPNNQILEKDLSAVWNQMTPPERQLATKPSQ